MSIHSGQRLPGAVFQWAIVALLLLAPSLAFSQSTFATLTGIVTDQSGALLSGATI